jgi:hypothetical protein
MQDTEYTPKYNINIQVGYGRSVKIQRVGTHRIVELSDDEATQAFFRHYLRVITDAKSREKFSVACRIGEYIAEEMIIHDPKEQALHIDSVAEWFYVLMTRINSIHEMMVTKTPIRLGE